MSFTEPGGARAGAGRPHRVACLARLGGWRPMLNGHEQAVSATRVLCSILRIVPDTARFGRAVVESGRLKAFESAGRAGPGLINAGVYLMPTDLFDGAALPQRFSFEHDFLAPALDRLTPAVCLAEGMFIDIGVPASFREAQTLIPTLSAAGRHVSAFTG